MVQEEEEGEEEEEEDEEEEKEEEEEDEEAIRAQGPSALSPRWPSPKTNASHTSARCRGARGARVRRRLDREAVGATLRAR
eukprot:8858684-Pyramimonas_sp.AAC.1